MKRVQVLIPFHMSETNTNHNPNDIIEVSEETLAKIKAINVNMVLVLGDVEKVEEAAEEITEEVIEEAAEEITEEVIEEAAEEITEEVIEKVAEKPKSKRK